MNRVSKRVWFVMLLPLALLLGLSVFLIRYAENADKWVLFSGNPHIYQSGNVSIGTVNDRSGEFLYYAGDKTYCEDISLRRSILHIVGDREGYISAPLLDNSLEYLIDYDEVSGLHGQTDKQITLTLCAEAQAAAVEALNGKKGTVGVYNYRTGEIICLVSSPNYDPEDVPDISSDADTYEGVYLNRFLQCTYTPGSVFKIATLAAALETIPDVDSMKFTCDGSMIINGTKIQCSGVHGTQTIEEAFRNSCNCAFAQLSQLVGNDAMSNCVHNYHITEAGYVDGISFVPGQFDLSQADSGAAAWAAVGQYTDLINPCSYMTFIGMIANGGNTYNPYLIASVSDDEKIYYTAEPEIVSCGISSEITAVVSSMMRNNVLEKYGQENFPDVAVCAKSGTAETTEGKNPTALFAGFITDPDYPYAFIAIVEDSGPGITYAAPVASTVLDACIKYVK